jgi:hypothetical protein
MKAYVRQQDEGIQDPKACVFKFKSISISLGFTGEVPLHDLAVPLARSCCSSHYTILLSIS